MTRPKTLLEMAGAPAMAVDWNKAVLLLIDHQQEYLSTGKLPLAGIDAAVAEVGRLLAAARAHAAPVVHIQHMGRAGGLFDPAANGAFVEAIRPAEGEAVVSKTLPNAFANTSLDETLQRIGRKELVVAGFMTHMCVSATVRSALDHGYRSAVVASACATRDLPDPIGGGVLSAGQVHHAALTALSDRFATIIADTSAISVPAAA
ncbi:cysteine hydrolase family protein [Ferrovibrio sp.]|uniref:cysteine hydrolase family protein n=1 Tax=Ferrovibrio sp. TaxID=1917215 RepID=UPI002ED57748